MEPGLDGEVAFDPGVVRLEVLAGRRGRGAGRAGGEALGHELRALPLAGEAVLEVLGVKRLGRGLCRRADERRDTRRERDQCLTEAYS